MKKLKFSYLILFVLVVSFVGKAQSPDISGPAKIVPSVPTTYVANNLLAGANPGSFVWSTNGNNVTHAAGATGNVRVFNITPNTTSCSFKIFFDYTITYTTTSGSTTTAAPQIEITIGVLPILQAFVNNVAVSTIYPGDVVRVAAVPLNSNVCTLPPNHNKTWVFTPTNTSFTTGVCLDNWCRDFTCPNTNIPTSILTDLNTGNQQDGYNQLVQLSLAVKLKNPSIIGDNAVGCTGSVSATGTTYSVSSVAGAAYWVWMYPTTLFNLLSPNLNGSSISLDAVETDTGVITVQAFASNGSPINSGVVSFPVQVCCISTRNETVTIDAQNSPYNREAALQINSTNSLASTGASTMHAGNEVRLLPGYTAMSGSQAHYYILGCTGNTLYSRPLPLPWVDEVVENVAVQPANDAIETVEAQQSTSKRIELNQDNNLAMDIKLIPNPTKGNFNLSIQSAKISPLSITILSSSGISLFNIPLNSTNNYWIDLTNFTDGMYAIRLNFADKIITKRIIKSN
jgi:Secretion system C-terminal sorting domain